MRRFLTQFVTGLALLLLVWGSGCQSPPEGEGSYSVPRFGGVPDQWEPEIAESIDTDDEDLELGL